MIEEKDKEIGVIKSENEKMADRLKRVGGSKLSTSSISGQKTMTGLSKATV